MAPGRKTGGRRKGVPNKVTGAAREAFLLTFGNLEGELESWIRMTASGDVRDGEVVRAPDPAKAADLMIRMAEYHFPKLGRQELTGPEGGPVEFTIRDLGKET